MTSYVTVKHNAEMAHRLWAIPGKCQNLHGHSWNIELSVTGELREDVPVIVEFGELKKELRDFVDEYLDHGTAIGYDDPLHDALVDDGGKLFLFGNSHWADEGEQDVEKFAEDLLWPTVEAVAILIGRYMISLKYNVVEVTVSETAVNQATWTPDE